MGHRKMFALLMAPLFMGGDDPDPGMSSGSSTGLSSNCKLITGAGGFDDHVKCSSSKKSAQSLFSSSIFHTARGSENPVAESDFIVGAARGFGWSSLGLRLMFGAHRIKWRTVIPGETLHITVHEGRELQPRASAMRILFGHLRFSLQHMGQVL